MNIKEINNVVKTKKFQNIQAKMILELWPDKKLAEVMDVLQTFQGSLLVVAEVMDVLQTFQGSLLGVAGKWSDQDLIKLESMSLADTIAFFTVEDSEEHGDQIADAVCSMIKELYRARRSSLIGGKEEE